MNNIYKETMEGKHDREIRKKKITRELFLERIFELRNGVPYIPVRCIRKNADRKTVIDYLSVVNYVVNANATYTFPDRLFLYKKYHDIVVAEKQDLYNKGELQANRVVCSKEALAEALPFKVSAPGLARYMKALKPEAESLRQKIYDDAIEGHNILNPTKIFRIFSFLDVLNLFLIFILEAKFVKDENNESQSFEDWLTEKLRLVEICYEFPRYSAVSVARIYMERYLNMNKKNISRSLRNTKLINEDITDVEEIDDKLHGEETCVLDSTSPSPQMEEPMDAKIILQPINPGTATFSAQIKNNIRTQILNENFYRLFTCDILNESVLLFFPFI